MFTVTSHAVLEPVGAADANEDASFPKIINFFAAEPEPARELFAETRSGSGRDIIFASAIGVGMSWDLGVG
jgi:hypothetical protein